MLPLEDVKVLDFSFHLPGPMASLILAEAGAEVIKVERLHTGDELRQIPPFATDESIAFAMLNRGKKSVSIDLKAASAFETLEPLLRAADVLVEQFRPGVMQRLGFGYDAVRAINPGIIYCSITGYGQTGPNNMKAGHDLNYCAEAGLLSLTKGSAGEPSVPQVTIADIAGGSYPAVMNILLALRRKDRTGIGGHLDIAMSRNLFALQYWAVGEKSVSGKAPTPSESLLTGGSPRYAIYRAGDGAFVAAAPIEDRFWERFCELLELPEEYRDDQLDPERTRRAVAAIIARNTADHWDSLLGSDCCCAKVRDVDEAMADEHFRTTGAFERTIETWDGRTIIGTTVPVVDALATSPAQLRAPRVGEHNHLLKS
ncbi:CaiB/BaiF CoA transferase family protein [Chelatococcus asaccharovorans]|uniref:Crotonobetainyl-CoA:carnitine CoA-transferase CaiB-like acyl-CoA transferase n=1 Tax=Chelatococcus asaccharovorans TaxID=28210 RepID=A0A2V3TTF8_9HYPH|nr:CoA transferase [Chelatococcus asaccharovorans]MBS7707838.1 CoA transferase [Chelatococcus asaccharovorans]PXW50915.1 crotonobetainyl-CoA:carnitine CoA-transferase CaiB-like acyl-CoA transferase [Chelatococcus asaccharovorans]